MLKDIFLAIVLGALLGFGLTGGYFAVKKNTPTVAVTPTATPIPSNDTQPSTTQPTPTILTTQSNQITISSPQNQSIVANSNITIKGNTSPNSYLIVSTPVKSYYASSDPVGNFTIDVEIESGANLISLNSFDSQDVQATTSLLVTYSTAKL